MGSNLLKIVFFRCPWPYEVPFAILCLDSVARLKLHPFLFRDRFWLMGFAYSVGVIKLLSFGVLLTFVLDFLVLQLLLHGFGY